MLIRSMTGNILRIFAFIFLFVSCNNKEIKIYGKVININSNKAIKNATIYSRAWVYNLKLDESYPVIDSTNITNRVTTQYISRKPNLLI